MILGIGDAQADALRFLKERGWWVGACARSSQGRGLSWVDRFEEIDIVDEESLMDFARKQEIDLVYSIGSDLALSSVEALSRRLGLPSFLSFKNFSVFRDKFRLREFLRFRGLSGLRYQGVGALSDAQDWSLFPAILKPVDSQGQRGIFKVDSTKALAEVFGASLGFSRSGRCLLEEFVEGPEISVNLFVSEDQVVFRSVADRLIYENAGTGIPRGHRLPSEFCVGEMLAETEALTEECVRAFGIENGPVYFQMKLTSEGPEIIEMTPRLDGCHLWRLIRASGGPDLLATSFERLAGGPPMPKWNGVFSKAYLGFFLDPPHRAFDQAHHKPPSSCQRTEYYYEKGEAVREVNGIMEKVGYFLQGGL